MAKIEFPNPRVTTPEGLVAVGGELTVESLRASYEKGIFPWPQEGLPLLWFCPPQRGVLDFKDLKISRSLRRALNRSEGSGVIYQFNQSFEEVVRACAEAPRPGQAGTWITEEVIQAYTDLFSEGEAWCFSARRGEDLIAGIYGVRASRYITGESMFFRESDQSKICFLKSVEVFSSLGFSWMDVQMVTSVTAQLGAKLIDRDDFLDRIFV